MTKRAGISHFFTKIVNLPRDKGEDYLSDLWPGDPLHLECRQDGASARTVVEVLAGDGGVLGHLRPDRGHAVAEGMAKGYSYHVYVTEAARGAPGEPPEVRIMVVVAEPGVGADEARRYVLEDRRLRRKFALDDPGSAKSKLDWFQDKLPALGMAALIIVVAIVLVAWLYS